MRAAPDILNADLGVEVNADNVSTAISGDYQATNTVHAVVRDLSKASAILASAVKAGGNETRLRGVLFAFDDDSRLLADARSRAFADAKSRAEQYAVLAGLKLTDVVTINEVSSRDENPKNPGAHRGGGFLRVRTRHPEGDFHRKSPGAWADYCQFGSVTTCAA